MRSAQRGAALIISLVFMVILTVVALSSMHSSKFEIKVARSVKSQVDALNVSEQVLLAGEGEICDYQVYAADCGGGPAIASLADASYFYSSPTVTGLSSIAEFDALSLANPSGLDGKYAVEYIRSVCMNGCSCAAGEDNAGCRKYIYRVTAKGKSAEGGSKLIQSYYFTIH